MKTVLLGATKGMGRALGRLMAERGDQLFLLGRDGEQLERSAGDLEVRGAQGAVKTAICDLLKPETFAPALDDAEDELDGLETVVVTAGLFGTQEQLEEDTDRAAQVLAANYTNTVLFCEQVRRRLLRRGGGSR